MQTIYRAKARAGEYSDFALNLAIGCTFGCRYCWAAKMAVDKRLAHSREAWHQGARLRPGITQALDKPIRRDRGPFLDPPVLLCFSHDPLQPVCLDAACKAMARLTGSGRRVVLLSKAGHQEARQAVEHIASNADPSSHWYGSSLTTLECASALIWEPKAASPAERLEALQVAKHLGLKTWVSLEPVIYPEHTMEVIKELARYHLVDHMALGKMNHMTLRQMKDVDPSIRPVDWPGFRTQAVALMEELGFHRSETNIPDTDHRTFYIKQDLEQAK